jgi:hypothetical protein
MLSYLLAVQIDQRPVIDRSEPKEVAPLRLRLRVEHALVPDQPIVVAPALVASGAARALTTRWS